MNNPNNPVVILRSRWSLYYHWRLSADRGRWIIRVSWWIIVCSNLEAYIVCDIFRKRKYKLPSSNQSILPYLYS